MGKYSAARDLDLTNRTIWYVLASRGEAAFYADRPESEFDFIDRLTNKRGARHEIDLVSDRRGRIASSAGGGTIRHAVGGDSVHHEESAKKFARKIAEIL